MWTAVTCAWGSFFFFFFWEKKREDSWEQGQLPVCRLGPKEPYWAGDGWKVNTVGDRHVAQPGRSRAAIIHVSLTVRHDARKNHSLSWSNPATEPRGDVTDLLCSRGFVSEALRQWHAADSESLHANSVWRKLASSLGTDRVDSQWNDASCLHVQEQKQCINRHPLIQDSGGCLSWFGAVPIEPCIGPHFHCSNSTRPLFTSRTVWSTISFAE